MIFFFFYPEQALKIIDTLKVSLVITDQRMEELDGDAIIREVHTRLPGVKCVKLTGYNNGITENTLTWKVVPKPWNEEDLKVLIREALKEPSQQPKPNTATNEEEI